MLLILLFSLFAPVYTFFFDFNNGQHERHQVSYEDSMLNQNCAGYTCPETQECVKTPANCPCPFPKSQLKCILPNGKYVCISKPATDDDSLNKIYDDPVRGPKMSSKGIRDCGWVEAAYKGLV